MKKVMVTIGAVLIAMVFLIVGCTSEVYSYDNFIDDLLDSGASVQVGEEIEKGYLSVQGRNILVNGERIQVFEYDNAALADEQVARISPDLSSIEAADGTIIVLSWAFPTYFYSKGRLIVVYGDVSSGADPSTRNVLENILGPEFAGPQFAGAS